MTNSPYTYSEMQAARAQALVDLGSAQRLATMYKTALSEIRLRLLSLPTPPKEIIESINLVLIANPDERTILTDVIKDLEKATATLP